jgi:hypothetical protein
MAASPVQKLCEALVRHRLLTADDAQALYRRWRTESPGQPDEADPFLRFLVAQGKLTEPQRQKLLGKRSERAQAAPGTTPVAGPTASVPTVKRPEPPTTEEFDVELVVVPPPRPVLPPGFNLDRRDWLMLALGAFGALLAVIAAVFLGRALKGEPPRSE